MHVLWRKHHLVFVGCALTRSAQTKHVAMPPLRFAMEQPAVPALRWQVPMPCRNHAPQSVRA